MTIRTKTIGRLPQNKSEWDPNYVNPGTGQRGYGQKFRVYRYGCELESKIENNTYDPFDWDGDQNFVLDVAHWELCSGNPKVWAAGNPKPAASEEYPYNGMGRVVIPKNMVDIAEEGEPENIVNLLTQAAFEDSDSNPLTNTVFFIQYDCVLGENITVPANCVLEFDGGSIIGSANCILTLNDCYLDGLPKFDTVVFSGSIKNDMFDATWIVNGSDIGAKINYAQTYFKRLKTTNAVYNLTTPVFVLNMAKIDFEGTFYYNGTIVNDGSAMEIKRAIIANIKIGSVQIPDMGVGVIDHTETRTKNFIGIKLTDCYGCYINIKSVYAFNEGVRFQGIEDAAPGCGLCKLDFNAIYNCNMGVRIYQYNGGWCNEIQIDGRKIGYMGDGMTWGTKYGVFIGGPAADAPSYATSGRTDSRDASSHVTVENGDYEGLDIIAYSRKCSHLSIIRVREEQVSCLAKFVGDNQGFYYLPGYTDISDTIDITESTNVSMNWKYEESISVKANAVYLQNPKGNQVFCNDTTALLKYVDSDYLIYKGCIIDTSSLKKFFIGTSYMNNTFIKMMNDEGTAFLPMSASQNTPVNGNNYNQTANGFNNQLLVQIPAGINKVFVGISSLISRNYSVEKLVISANYPIKLILHDFLIGSFADKPAKMEEGLGYYATDLNKLVYYNSTDSKWYDAVGNEVNV